MAFDENLNPFCKFVFRKIHLEVFSLWSVDHTNIFQSFKKGLTGGNRVIFLVSRIKSESETNQISKTAKANKKASYIYIYIYKCRERERESQ